MAIRIQYQNNVTGAAFDITTLVSGAKWSTKRSGSPASLELTAIVNDEIQWSHGGIVTLLDDKTGLFYGYVVKISQNEKEQVQITAYDQTWYLKKNKDTYVFKGKRADQVLKQIAEDFKLKTGSLANTAYSIPSMIEDGQTLFDIVLKAIDYTLINTGKMFVLWDNFGKLTLTDVETAKLDLFVGDGSLATGFTYESEIDSEAYTYRTLLKYLATVSEDFTVTLNENAYDLYIRIRLEGYAQRDALAATLGQMIPANLVLRLRTDIPQDDQPAKTAACSAMATMNRHKYTPAT